MPAPGSDNQPDAGCKCPCASAPADEKPDRFGDGLKDDARIWRVYHKAATEVDTTMVEGWNRGLDTLALFAGLFSAVTTAFIIESYKQLQPDWTEFTYRALTLANHSDRAALETSFRAPPTARAVNVFWIFSLLFSLSAALIAIMGKDWIADYPTPPAHNLRQWAELRQFRYDCVKAWLMPEVIASAPLLLHISLFLFAAGLVTFLIPVDRVTMILTATLFAVATVLYAFTALSPIISSRSPFRSPSIHLFLSSSAREHEIFTRAADKPSTDERRAARWLRFLHDRLAKWKTRLTGWITRRPSPDPSRAAREEPSTTQPPLTASAQTRSSSFEIVGSSLPIHITPSHTQPARSSWYDLWRFVTRLMHRTPTSPSNACDQESPVPRDLWTYLPVTSSPDGLTRALSWLNEFRPSPDALRDIMTALGDLEVADDVAPYVSLALRDRIVAELTRNEPSAMSLSDSTRCFLAGDALKIAGRHDSSHPAYGHANRLMHFAIQKDPESSWTEAILRAWLFCGLDALPRFYPALLCQAIAIRPSTFNKLLARRHSLDSDAIEPVIFVLRGWISRLYSYGGHKPLQDLLEFLLPPDVAKEYRDRRRRRQARSELCTRSCSDECNIIELLSLILSRVQLYHRSVGLEGGGYSLDTGNQALAALLSFIQKHDGCHRSLLDDSFPTDDWPSYRTCVWKEHHWTAKEVHYLLDLLPTSWQSTAVDADTALSVVRILTPLLAPEQDWYKTGDDYRSMRSAMEHCSCQLSNVLASLPVVHPALTELLANFNSSGFAALSYANFPHFSGVLLVAKRYLHDPDTVNEDVMQLISFTVRDDAGCIVREWNLASWLSRVPMEGAWWWKVNGQTESLTHERIDPQQRFQRRHSITAEELARDCLGPIFSTLNDLRSRFPDATDWQAIAQTVHSKSRTLSDEERTPHVQAIDRFCADMGFDVRTVPSVLHAYADDDNLWQHQWWTEEARRLMDCLLPSLGNSATEISLATYQSSAALDSQDALAAIRVLTRLLAPEQDWYCARSSDSPEDECCTLLYNALASTTGAAAYDLLANFARSGFYALSLWVFEDFAKVLLLIAKRCLDDPDPANTELTRVVTLFLSSTLRDKAGGITHGWSLADWLGLFPTTEARIYMSSHRTSPEELLRDYLSPMFSAVKQLSIRFPDATDWHAFAHTVYSKSLAFSYEIRQPYVEAIAQFCQGFGVETHFP